VGGSGYGGGASSGHPGAEASVAPYRLPRTAVPSRYDIRLEPDFTTLTFRGQETVAVEVTEPISEIVLNAIELAIDSASLENDRGETIRATATMDDSADRCRL